MLLQRDDDQSDDSHADEVVAKNIAQIVESFLYLGAARDREKLQGGVPCFALSGKHEEDQERNEGAFENESVERADAAKKKRVHGARVGGGSNGLGSPRGSGQVS